MIVMKTRFEQITEKIEELYLELDQELKEKREEFSYSFKNGRVKFDSAVQQYQKKFRKDWILGALRAPAMYIITAPFIYVCFIGFLMVDILVSLYQTICFPVYGIPKVKRKEFVVHDRHKLQYLNIIEKINCEYCAYGNGVLAYASEISSRTELFWCPIKHSKTPRRYHERYVEFIDYGDGESYRARIGKLRDKCRACDGCQSTEN